MKTETMKKETKKTNKKSNDIDFNKKTSIKNKFKSEENKLVDNIKVEDKENKTSSSTKLENKENKTSSSVKLNDKENKTSSSVKLHDKENKTSSSVKLNDKENKTSSSVKLNDKENKTLSEIKLNEEKYSKLSNKSSEDKHSKVVLKNKKYEKPNYESSHTKLDLSKINKKTKDIKLNSEVNKDKKRNLSDPKKTKSRLIFDNISNNHNNNSIKSINKSDKQSLKETTNTIKTMITSSTIEFKKKIEKKINNELIDSVKDQDVISGTVPEEELENYIDSKESQNDNKAYISHNSLNSIEKTVLEENIYTEIVNKDEDDEINRNTCLDFLEWILKQFKYDIKSISLSGSYFSAINFITDHTDKENLFTGNGDSETIEKYYDKLLNDQEIDFEDEDVDLQSLGTSLLKYSKENICFFDKEIYDKLVLTFQSRSISGVIFIIQKLPFIIHNRDAALAIINMLVNYKSKKKHEVRKARMAWADAIFFKTENYSEFCLSQNDKDFIFKNIMKLNWHYIPINFFKK